MQVDWGDAERRLTARVNVLTGANGGIERLDLACDRTAQDLRCGRGC